MNLEMTEDRIMVEQQVEEQTDGGIIIPQDSQSPTDIGQVIAIGPDASDVQVGDTVVYDRKYTTVSHIGEKVYRVCKSRHIKAVIDE